MTEWKFDDLKRFIENNNVPIDDVKILDISNENLNKIPQEVFKLTSLKILYCSKNNISVIPSEIENLTHLEKLYLCYNNIETIPDECCNLKNLKQLHIFNNKISSLPKNILNLTNLIQLDVTNNRIENIDDVPKLNNLERFYGRNNGIKQISFDKLNNKIEHFDISQNKISNKGELKVSRYDTHLIC